MDTRERLKLIRQDSKADAARYDGMSFTGGTVGPILGEHLAMVYALAASLLEVLDRVEAIDATLDRAEAAAARRTW